MRAPARRFGAAAAARLRRSAATRGRRSTIPLATPRSARARAPIRYTISFRVRSRVGGGSARQVEELVTTLEWEARQAEVFGALRAGNAAGLALLRGARRMCGWLFL